MDNLTTNNPKEHPPRRYKAIYLKPAGIAAFFALFAFGNVLLYWPGGFFLLPGSPFEVFGFRDDPIGWWGFASILFTIIFCVLAAKIARQGFLYGAQAHNQPNSLRRIKRILLALTILFAVPNVLIAVMHIGAIQSGFSYWGKVRAAYEVPNFHLLPMLLLLYWWFSSRK